MHEKCLDLQYVHLYEHNDAIIVCFFLRILSSISRIFHFYGDVTIAGEGLQMLAFARHSWPLSSEGSNTCHTYCDTTLPLIMVISEDPWHSHLLPSVWHWSCLYLFLRLKFVATTDRTPDHPHERRTLYVNATAVVDLIFFPWALNMIQLMKVSKFFRDYTHLKNPAKTRGLYDILRCSRLVPPTT